MKSQRIVLISGANRGLGLATAQLLAQQGWQVWLGSRSLAEGKAAASVIVSTGGKAEAVQLDVTNAESIQAAVDLIAQRSGYLSLLINNAGANLDQGYSPSQIPLQVIRDSMELNFLGAIRLVQAVLPLLRKGTNARIVNVSTGLASLTQLSDPNYRYYGFNVLAYTASKAALNAFTVTLAKELVTEGISVHSADPEWCRTALGGADAPYTEQDGAQSIVTAALQPLAPTGGFYLHGKTVAW